MNPLSLGRFQAFGRLYLAIGLVCAALFLALAPQAASADTTVTLFKSFAGDINYVTTGNTLRAAPNDTYTGGNACSLLSGLTGTSVNAGTSSSPLSGIPAGSTIIAAYLYYAGSGATVDSAVTFNGTNVTASRTFTSTTGGHDFFSGFVDVTSLVTGNGTYSFGNLAVDDSAGDNCTNSTVLAGWTLTVIYSNSSTESLRVINVFDGFEAFAGSSITLNPNNFQIPSTGINGKFSVITWEGDPDINSTNGANNLTETLEFNGNVLSDACNPTADTSLPNGSNGGAFVSGNPNQYNSTINTLSCTGTLTPTGDEKYFGVDFDTFDVTSYLSAGQTSATTFYSTGQDTVFLTAQIISVSNTPTADLGITKVHNGTFGYGNNGTYTITVTNTGGPNTSTGTITVTDQLNTANETYVSGTGTGWTCTYNATNTTVTCTNPNTTGLAVGASLPAITLTVNVATAGAASITNSATVSATTFDNNSTNNTSSDTTSPVHPDLTTSSKTVVNTSGGDANPGDTLQYTITLTETGGVAASGVSVTDNAPATMSGFTASAVTVTGSTTTITNASTNTGGTNGDGLVSISNITVPANGTVTIVFTAQVASGAANCTAINNTGTIANPNGSTTTVTVTAPTIVVAQSQCASSGNKVLYFYGTVVTGTTYKMSRATTATNTSVSIAGNTGTASWEQQPVAAKSIVIPAQTVTVALYMTRGGANSNRTVKVALAKNSAPGTLLGSQTLTFNPGTTETLETFSFTITATTVVAGDALLVEVTNSTGTAGNTVLVWPLNGTAKSTLTFNTTTVVNVDSVTAYSTAYSTTTTPTGGVFPASQTGKIVTVYICAVVSDPFGSFDATSATVNITDPNGTVQVSNAAMTAEGATDCSGVAQGTPNTYDEAYEYAYNLPIGGATGFWTAQVTGHEGTEGTISQTSNGAFDVDVPNLLIMKTVSVASDPVEGTTKAKAIPGANVLFTILVQNNGHGPVDSGSLVITDPVPTNTGFYLNAATPFGFTDGSPVSGLSAPVMTFSNNGGSTYVYSPTCSRPCTDVTITNFKITFTGSMNGKSVIVGSTAPSFTITYTVVLQ